MFWDAELTMSRAVIFMNNILKDPERVFDYARLYTVSVAGSLIWGHRATGLDSFWYNDFYKLMDLVILLSTALFRSKIVSDVLSSG
jgi:hypothetical protein